MADSVRQMVIDMDKAKVSGADLVEIRLDSLKSFNPNVDIETLIKQCPLPTLFTYRFIFLIELHFDIYLYYVTFFWFIELQVLNVLSVLEDKGVNDSFFLVEISIALEYGCPILYT